MKNNIGRYDTQNRSIMVYYQNISAYKWSHAVDEKLEFEIEIIHLNPS